MSNINIKRAIDNIRTNTTIYTPVVEVIVNAIQAIEESGRTDGRVSISALRSGQTNLDGGIPEIIGFEIKDNGIGFTDDHRNSFDTLYTDHRIGEGGKGFGRLICLKYFEDVFVDSVFKKESGYKARKFSMGKRYEIIVSEEISETESQESGSIVRLMDLKKRRRRFNKRLLTVARNIVDAFSHISLNGTTHVLKLYSLSRTAHLKSA